MDGRRRRLIGLSAERRRAAASPPAGPAGRSIPAIVDAGWLQARLGEPDLVVLDVRDAESYAAGHVPGAVSEPFVVPACAWIVLRDGLLLEFPDADDLSAAVGRLGIRAGSRVVVISAPAPGAPPAYGFAAATRVALTLIHAGVPDVAVLDGGFDGWTAAGLPTSTAPVTPGPVVHDAPPRTDVLITREGVSRLIGRARIIDTRDPDVYFGRVVEDFAPRPGHIPTARSLPAPWIWAPDGTYAAPDVLERMAAGVVGTARRREVIVYCGVGGYASAWWFLLTQALGYTRVRFYDGSAQEWCRGSDELVAYRWE